MLTLSRSGQRYSEPLVAPAQTRRRDMTHSANALKKHGWCRLRDLNPRPTVYKAGWGTSPLQYTPKDSIT